MRLTHDDVIKWKHFPRNWPFVRGIYRSPVNSPHKGQWRGALMFSLICVWINDWVNNREAGDVRRYRAHYDVFVMYTDYTVVLDTHAGEQGQQWVMGGSHWTSLKINRLLPTCHVPRKFGVDIQIQTKVMSLKNNNSTFGTSNTHWPA